MRQARAREGQTIPFGPRLLTPKQAAEYIGQNVKSVYKLLRSREIPHIPTERGILVDRFDLDQWAENNKVGFIPTKIALGDFERPTKQSIRAEFRHFIEHNDCSVQEQLTSSGSLNRRSKPE